jgi:hypothetical protein
MGSSPLGSSVSSSLHHVNPFPDGCIMVPASKDLMMTGPPPTVDAGSHSTRVQADPIGVHAQTFNRKPRITPWGFIRRPLD